MGDLKEPELNCCFYALFKLIQDACHRIKTDSNRFGQWLDEWSCRVCRSYGRLVARWPLPFLLIPLILTVLLGCGLAISFDTITDIDRLFTPIGAPSIREAEAFANFTNSTSMVAYFDVVVRRRDGGSLLDSNKTIPRLVRQYDRHYYNLTVDWKNQSWSLAKICNQSKCDKSVKALSAFQDIFFSNVLRKSPNIKLNYPVLQILDNQLNLCHVMANVTTLNNTAKIDKAYLLRLITWLEIDNKDLMPVINRYGRAFRKYYEEDFYDPVYEYFVGYFQEVDDELAKLSDVTVPFFGISIFLLAAFTISSSLTGVWTTSKPGAAAAGVANPCLALIAAVGMINFCSNDLGWNGTLSCMPFLIFAIGVDDMFVFLSSWHSTSRSLSVEERMAEVMAEAGVSVMVTSITNISAFACGILQNVFAVQLFGIYASVALLFEYVYQHTFFLSILVYSGRQEETGNCCTANASSCSCCDRISSKLSKNKLTSQQTKLDKVYPTKPEVASHRNGQDGAVKEALPAARIEQPLDGKGRKVYDKIFGEFLPALSSWPIFRIAIFVLFAANLIAALYGCTIVVASVTPAKFAFDGTKFQTYTQLTDATIGDQCLTATVIITHPPDFNDQNETKEFYRFVHKMDTIPKYSVGPMPVELWLTSYYDFLTFSQVEDFYAALGPWKDTSAYKRQWKDKIRLRQNSSGSYAIESFSYSVYNHNTRLFEDRIELLKAWRAISAQFPQLGAYVYQFTNKIDDQIIAIPDNIMQDTGVALLSILFISIFMVRNAFNLFWIAYLLLTIEAGVIGFLKFIVDAELDTLSMTTLTLSVGLSVDYLLHVAFCFHRANAASRKERSRQALRLIGWPVIQATVSAILGVIGLAFVHSYVPRLFFSTVVLVVLLGIVHCLLVLPMIFNSLD